MINSKQDLNYYIDCDMKARFGEEGKINFAKKISALLIPHPWYFQVLLRKAEYYTNCGPRNLRRTIGNFMKFRAYRYGAKFGSNVRIQSCVNIGTFSKFDENWKKDAAPRFGNNIYIGPGAKIWGPITIGDNTAIGANAVVSKSFEGHCTIVGANKILNNEGSIDMIRYGDKSKMPEESYAYIVTHK